jgi:hypothetical protein
LLFHQHFSKRLLFPKLEIKSPVQESLTHTTISEPLLREQSVHHSIKPSGGLVIKPLCVLVMREVKTFGLLSISKTPYIIYI